MKIKTPSITQLTGNLSGGNQQKMYFQDGYMQNQIY